MVYSFSSSCGHRYFLWYECILAWWSSSWSVDIPWNLYYIDYNLDYVGINFSRNVSLLLESRMAYYKYRNWKITGMILVHCKLSHVSDIYLKLKMKLKLKQESLVDLIDFVESVSRVNYSIT